MNRVRWILAAAVAAVALVLGGWLLYATVLNDPAAELTTEDLAERLDDSVAPTPAPTAPVGTDPATTEPVTSQPVTTEPVTTEPATTGLEGEWRVTGGSEAGYRVAETLGGIATEGVGRTDQVTGSITISDSDPGITVTTAEFGVDVASIRSDSDRRDGQFAGRIMDAANHPTATFVLTQPIDIGPAPADGTEVTVSATGDLTLRGVTRSVTFDLTARIDNGRVGVLAAIPIVFADFDIANPSFGPVQTEDEGVLEVLLVLERA